MDDPQYLRPASILSDIQSENLENVLGSQPQIDNLLNYLDADDLNVLKHYFFPAEDVESLEKRRYSNISDYEGVSLSKNQLVDAIQDVFGKEHLNSAAEKYFDDLQKCNFISTSINWNQFLDSIIVHYKKKRKTTDCETEDIIRLKNQYTFSHAKDPVMLILPLETETSFCYVFVNYMGKVSTYSHGMVLHHQYDVPLLSGINRRHRYISSALTTFDGTCIFIATSERFLYVYDAKRLIHILKFVITGIPNNISCMVYNKLSLKGKSLLLLGDDSGSIHSLVFHQPTKSFFKQSQDSEVSIYHWKELKSQELWLNITTDQDVHKDYVMEIRYNQDNDTILSCSPDPSTSVVIKQREGNKLLHVTKLNKSLKCFDLERKLGFLATCTSDPYIYLWNCSAPTVPIIKLDGHEKNVVDVCFIAHRYAVLTISEDGVIKLWHVEKFKCVQTINLGSTFSREKIYFRPRKLFKRRAKVYNKSGIASDQQPEHTSKELTKCVFVVQKNVVSKFDVGNDASMDEEKPMPPKTLSPIMPAQEVIYSNYNREHPLTLSMLFNDVAVDVPVQEDEKPLFDNKFFLKQGAVHLGLKLWDVDEDFIGTFDVNLSDKL